VLFVPALAMAQHDPIYAQYLNNPVIINPAYAGNNLMLNGGVQYRSQWAGIEANPTTFTFSSHSSVLNNKMGVGATITQDKIGETISTEFNSVFSYMIAFKTSRLSFGMQTGFTRYTTDPSKLTIRDNGDPSFRQLRATTFNVGSGILLTGDHYMIGISAPRLLPVSINQDGASIKLYDQSYYLFGAYAFVLSEKFKIRPSVLLRTTTGVPVSADVNAGLIVQENYAIGLLTRNFNTYGVQFLALINDLKLGYVLEVPGGSESKLNFASHEFMISMSVGVIRYHNNVNRLY
jgi:type IX secretion system PorP/SprF family membrane protein